MRRGLVTSRMSIRPPSRRCRRRRFNQPGGRGGGAREGCAASLDRRGSPPMSRPLPQPRRADMAPDDLELFDYAVSRQYPDAAPGDEPDLGLYHGTLLNSPAFARLFELGGETVRLRGEDADSYSQRDRAFVDHVLSAELRTNAVLAHFVTEGLSLGIDIPTQRAVREGRDGDLSDDDRFLAEYARATVRGELTDEQWERMVQRLGPKGTLEY